MVGLGRTIEGKGKGLRFEVRAWMVYDIASLWHFLGLERFGGRGVGFARIGYLDESTFFCL